MMSLDPLTLCYNESEPVALIRTGESNDECVCT